MAGFAKRNHYNPCFWTAYWSPPYYAAVMSGGSTGRTARQETVHALNLKADRLRESSVDDVHFEKGLGVAEITREGAEGFCRRFHPEQLDEFLIDNATAAYPVYIDFEDFLTGMENMRPYQVLRDVIRHGAPRSPEEKADLACWIVLQHLRGHAIMNSMLELNDDLGRPKFEHFIQLRWMLQDRSFLLKTVGPIASGRWTFYVSDVDEFPLSDSPVMVGEDGIMVPLSPRLLLQVQTRFSSREDEWRVRRPKRSKLEEFRRRAIGGAFREIVFSSPTLLEAWRATPEFRRRHELVKSLKKYNSLVREEADGELWHINAFGSASARV